MKAFLTFGLLLIGLCASAQSVALRIISNDGSIQATNTINVPALMVTGLVSAWQDDSRTKTNSGAAALTFNQFITQELTDKGAEWNRRGGLDGAKALGLTNVPPKLADLWPTLTVQQRTNAIAVLNLIQ